MSNIEPPERSGDRLTHAEAMTEGNVSEYLMSKGLEEMCVWASASRMRNGR